MAILLIVFETLADARSSSTLTFIRVTVAHAATETIENRPLADLQKTNSIPATYQQGNVLLAEFLSVN